MKKSKNATTKYLIYTGLYLAILVLAIIFGIMPLYNSLNKNQKTLADTKSELNATEKKRLGLEELSRDQAKIDLIKQTTLEYLPDNKNNSDFVVKVEALAKDLSITIDSFSFTEAKIQTPAKADTSEETGTSKDTSTSKTTTKKEAPKTESEFSLNFSSDYGLIMQFIEKLESFPRVNTIDSITVSGYDKESGKVDLRITGRIFYGK